MKIYKDIYYKDNQDIRNALDIYLPEDEVQEVFVFFHGGGMLFGDKLDVDHFVNELIDEHIALVSCNYHFIDETPFPRPLFDAVDAVAWVMNNIQKYTDCKNIYVGGQSCGGYLSQMICFDTKLLKERGINPLDIKGYFFDAGQPTTHYNVLKYSGIDERRVIIDERAPLFYVGLEEKYPDMLFIVADNDMLNRFEQTKLMISAMKTYELDMSKVELKIIPNSTHCSYTKNICEDGFPFYARLIIDFIKKR